MGDESAIPNFIGMQNYTFIPFAFLTDHLNCEIYFRNDSCILEHNIFITGWTRCTKLWYCGRPQFPRKKWTYPLLADHCSSTPRLIFSFFSFAFLQALCGTVICVPTLTGEKIQLSLLDEIIKPTTVKRIPAKGLPFPKEPNRRGDLLVNFDIKFPDSLSTNVKDILYDTLPNEC